MAYHRGLSIPVTKSGKTRSLTHLELKNKEIPLFCLSSLSIACLVPCSYYLERRIAHAKPTSSLCLWVYLDRLSMVTWQYPTMAKSGYTCERLSRRTRLYSCGRRLPGVTTTYAPRHSQTSYLLETPCSKKESIILLAGSTTTSIGISTCPLLATHISCLTYWPRKCSWEVRTTPGVDCSHTLHHCLNGRLGFCAHLANY
jgi:hypothetical protein